MRLGHAAGRTVRLLTGPAGLGPAVALALIALLAAFLATAGPRESTRLQNGALRQTLAASPAFGIFASGETTVTGSRQMITPKQLGVAGGVLGSALFPPLISPQAERWSGVTSPQSTVLNPVSRAVLVGPPVFETDYFGPLAGNTRLLSGSYPRTASATHKAGKTIVTMQCVVTRATAARFGLRAGAVLTLQSQASSLGAVQVVLKVTGLVKPVNPAGSFWNYDPPAAAPTVVGSYWAGAALIGPGELAAFPAAYPQQLVHVAWAFPLQTRTLTVAQVSTMVQAMTTVAASSIGNQALTRSRIQLSSAPTVYADGLGTLTTFQAGQAATGAVDALLTDGLFAVALILLLACALVVSDAYDAEVSLILARGGSIRQAALRILGRGAVAAVPALAAGVVVGLAVTPGGGPPEIWLVTAVAVTALGAPPLITAWRHRGSRPVATTDRTDLVVPTHSRRRLVAEATVLIAIVGAVVALRVRGVSPGSGSDPYLSSAPVLVAVAAGLIAARVYPVPLRLLLRVTSPRKAPVGFLGIARAARSRSAALLPGLALVVALAVIALGGTLRAAVNRGQVAASWQQVGADAVIRSGGSRQVIGPAPQRAFAAVPGVTHTAAIDLVAPGDPQAAQLLTGGAQFGVHGRAGGQPAAVRRADRRDPVPGVPGQPARPAGNQPGGAGHRQPRGGHGAQEGRQPAGLCQQHADGAAGRDAGAHAGSAQRRAVRHHALLGRPLAEGRRTAERPARHRRRHQPARPAPGAGRRTLPAGQILSRQAVLTAKTQLPSVRESNLAFELCVAAAVAVSIAAVLLGLLLSGRDRTRVAAWLAALGMTGRQARRLAMLDALPLVLIAVLGAEVAGAVLAPTVAPALDLSVFTGSSAAVPVRLDAMSMIAPAVAAIVLVVVITAAQNTLTRRRTKTGVLRLDEGR